MKQFFLALIFGQLVLSSCQDESPFGPDDPIPSTPMTGTINNQAWQMQSVGGRYDFSNGGQGDKVETISLYFFEVPDFQFCYGILDTSLGPFLNLTLEPKIGRQTVGVNTFVTGFFLQNVSYQYTISGDVVVDELDTSGIGYIKGRISYRNSSQGSPSDKVEGSFETTLCRDRRKLEFLDQEAQGIMNGRAWTVSDGVGYGRVLDLFDFAVPSDICQTQENYYPSIRIFVPRTIELGYFTTEDQPSGPGSILSPYARWDPIINPPFLSGALEIVEIDTANELVSGRIDLFSNTDSGYAFNGNFSVRYCNY